MKSVFMNEEDFDQTMECLTNCWYYDYDICGYGKGDKDNWDFCKKCKYGFSDLDEHGYERDDADCMNHLLWDVEEIIKCQAKEIELLKRQIKSIKQGFFSKLLTLDELLNFIKNESDGSYVCCVESKTGELSCVVFEDVFAPPIDNPNNYIFVAGDIGSYPLSAYNVGWRCWTFEPTYFQMKNTPWEAKLCE